MSELNASELFGKLQDIKNKLSEETADSVPSKGGQLDVETAAKIEKMIAEMVSSFKGQKSFSWRVHILDPIYATVEIAKSIDDYSDRAAIEILVGDILTGLYKEYSPKLPWIPQFVSNWVTGILVSSVIPSAVDWILDKIYGPDED